MMSQVLRTIYVKGKNHRRHGLCDSLSFLLSAADKLAKQTKAFGPLWGPFLTSLVHQVKAGCCSSG